MNVCFIAEGSYPYVLGGVSSWIQQLITSMPEIQFSILAIAANCGQQGKFKYAIPANVTEIKEVFLETRVSAREKYGKRLQLKESEKKALMDLICGADCDWERIFELMGKGRIGSIPSFLLSKDFVDIAEEACEKNFFYVPFTDFYWNVRSMMMPLLQLLCSGYPQADIYHSVSAGYAGIMGAYIKHRSKKPYLLTEHGLYSREREEEIIKATWLKSYCKNMWINFFYTLSRESYLSADKVLTLFSKNREIEIELGCPHEKIGIIPNGVNLDSFDSTKAAHEEMISIGAIVRVVPIKDIVTLLHAFAYAKERNRNLRLYVIGPTDEDAEYYNECLQLVGSMSLTDVIFTGTMRIAEIMGQLDIIALTSISEGQPFAVLEAMAARKPCVTTDVGACRELLEDFCDGIGKAGIICPVMDYEEIGRAFYKLSVSESLRSAMGEAGNKRVRARYTKELMVSSYRNLYLSYGVQ